MVKSHSLLSLPHSLLTFFKVAFISVFIGVLVGCPAHVSKPLDFDETKGSQYYLSQASNTSGSEQINWQLLAVRSLMQEDNLGRAKQLFNQLPVDLNKEQQKEKLLLQGELAIKYNQSFDLTSLVLSELNDNQKIRYYKINIGLNAQKQDINALIRDYIELEKYGTDSQRHHAINETWNFLTSLDTTSINSVLVYANEPVLQGWIDLIYTYHNNINIYVIDDSDSSETVAKKEEAQFNLIKNAVNEWQMQYSTHPAALYLPRNIYGEKYRLPDDSHKKSVGLFLPLSGSSKVFGDTIYLGYKDAAKLYAQETGQNIYVYDTNSNSIEALVTQAKQQGVELIVGPLLKQNVLNVMQLSPSIPVLALNKIDSTDYPNNFSSQICFFALSPEDEAKDAAEHIYKQKKRNPLLIVSKNNLGERVANSFLEQWNLMDPALDGIHVQYFESAKSLSSQMNSGVGIEIEGTPLTNTHFEALQNQPEPDQLNTLLNTILPNDSSEAELTLTATPQPLQPEFDAIYIYATHEELTLIKSMLEMKSSKVELDEEGNAILDSKDNEIAIKKIIPALYASSRSNTANTTQDFRYDMDRMQFSDIPLIINQSQMVEELPDYIKNDYSLVRLYAMGIDAWQLANRFSQLEPYQIDILNGMTGKLSVAKQCEITRTLTWQRYRNGKQVVVK